ncbi:MAG: ribbon-helix-helix domain-containing protein [Cyanobium sp.]
MARSRKVAYSESRSVTLTVPQATAEHLVQRSIREGRSLSNLAAVLLERAITAEQIQPSQQGDHG